MFWLNNVAKFSTALRRISTERWFDNQSGMYLSDFLRLFTIHTILELSTFNRSRSSATRQWLYLYAFTTEMHAYTTKKPRLIYHLLMIYSKIPSYYLCARTHYLRHEWHFTKVTRCSNPNAHAQFPLTIPYLTVSDHYWFSISLLPCAILTFLLQVCHYRATLN